MTPEGKVKAAVKRWLKREDIWYYCPMQNGMGVVGIPDFVCCDGGLFFAIETKAPGRIRNLSQNQKRRIEEIRQHGGAVFVTDDVEKLQQEYRKWKDSQGRPAREKFALPDGNGTGEVDYRHRLLFLPEHLQPVLEHKKVKHVVTKGRAVFKYSSDNYSRLRKTLQNVLPPMAHYYRWSGRYAPYRAQRITALALSCTPRMYVLNSMGTGKTLSALWAYDWLRQEGVLRRAVVLTPLSTVDRVWRDEVETHFPHLSVAVVHGTRAKRMSLLQQDHDVYVLNHDALRVKGLTEEMGKRDDLDLFIVDEGATFRESRTDKYSRLRRYLQNRSPWIWWMTGTPMPNAPTDVWAQCMLVTPRTVPPHFKKWREQTMISVSPYIWRPRPNAVQMCYQAMRPAVRFSLDDCVDLPPCVHTHRSVPLTAEQRKVYRELQEKVGAQIQGRTITPVNAGVLVAKLMQACEGVVFDDNGDPVLLDYSERRKELDALLEQAGHKVIVFASYVPTLLRLHDSIPDSLLVYGDTSRVDRERAFSLFQNKRSKYSVLIAQPSTMSHGLTLTESNVIVWFGAPRGNEVYLQANARIVRPGQKHKTVIAHITSTKAEAELYRRYASQSSMQGLLLMAVREKVR